MMDKKKEFRKESLKKRNEMDALLRDEEDLAIFEQLKTFQERNHFQHYLCYINYKSEVDTKRFITWLQKASVSVYAPKVTGDEMDFYKITCLDELEKGYQGILEPKQSENMLFQELVAEKERVCMILPGCAFDYSGNRMGYGGGYYDRYLSKWSKTYSIHKTAVAYELQMMNRIPHEPYDQKVDCIISKKGCITCSI